MSGKKISGRGAGQGGNGAELMRLKRELVAARERGEQGALGRVVAAHPAFVGELAEFAAAMAATSGYERETLTAETMALAERARVRAMESAFPAATISPATEGLGARAAAVTLKSLRRARQITLVAAARRLSLGLDVLQNLEAGLIRAASVPDRLTRALGDLLQTSADQVRAAIETQGMMRPALQRDRTPGAGEPEMLDFTDAVRLSPSMSDEQRHAWLDEPQSDR